MIESARRAGSNRICYDEPQINSLAGVLCMKLAQIEAEALSLPETERAKLAQKLLLSLDNSSESGIAESWLDTVQGRARELDEGIVEPISADEVRRKAQALLR